MLLPIHVVRHILGFFSKVIHAANLCADFAVLAGKLVQSVLLRCFVLFQCGNALHVRAVFRHSHVGFQPGFINSLLDGDFVPSHHTGKEPVPFRVAVEIRTGHIFGGCIDRVTLGKIVHPAEFILLLLTQAVIALPAGIAGARGGKCAYFFCSICGIVRKLGKIISPVFYIVFNVIHKVVFCIVFLAPLCFLADAVSSIYNA